MKILASALTLLLFVCNPIFGGVIFTASGTSAKGVDVVFQATFTITGDNLEIFIENISTAAIMNPDDVLGSLYFDIVDGNGDRPTLSNYVATGDVYLTDKDGPDTLFEANADLVADTAGDGTWQFKQSLDPSLLPNTKFGVGTVGNNALSPNGFNGNITGAINYSIFNGNITTSNLNGKYLVKDSISMSFTGVTGFEESDIGSIAFGLGTAPDSLIFPPSEDPKPMVPEPASFAVFAVIFGIGVGSRKRRRMTST